MCVPTLIIANFDEVIGSITERQRDVLIWSLTDAFVMIQIRGSKTRKPCRRLTTRRRTAVYHYRSPPDWQRISTAHRPHFPIGDGGGTCQCSGSWGWLHKQLVVSAPSCHLLGKIDDMGIYSLLDICDLCNGQPFWLYSIVKNVPIVFILPSRWRPEHVYGGCLGAVWPDLTKFLYFGLFLKTFLDTVDTNLNITNESPVSPIWIAPVCSLTRFWCLFIEACKPAAATTIADVVATDSAAVNTVARPQKICSLSHLTPKADILKPPLFSTLESVISVCLRSTSSNAIHVYRIGDQRVNLS